MENASQAAAFAAEEKDRTGGFLLAVSGLALAASAVMLVVAFSMQTPAVVGLSAFGAGMAGLAGLTIGLAGLGEKEEASMLTANAVALARESFVAKSPEMEINTETTRVWAESINLTPTPRQR